MFEMELFGFSEKKKKKKDKYKLIFVFDLVIKLSNLT